MKLSIRALLHLTIFIFSVAITNSQNEIVESCGFSKIMSLYNFIEDEDYNKISSFYTYDLCKELKLQTCNVMISHSIITKDWDEAILWLERKRKTLQIEFNDWSTAGEINTIIGIIEMPEKKITITKLGPEINSEKNDYFPVISADGNTLYFVRNDLDNLNEDATLYDTLLNMKEDIWMSKKIKGEWTPSEKVEELNTLHNDAILSVSVSNTKCFCFSSGDIMVSEIDDDGKWSEMKKFGKPFSDDYWEADVNFSSDGRLLFFTALRPDNLRNAGDTIELPDIYVSEKRGDSWSEPINLGKVINTPYTERNPFFAADGKTLYFSSDGHPGLGGLDVFKTTRNGDSWTAWTTPVNLGKQINTAGSDWAFRLTASGDKAYISASDPNDHNGNIDIYSIKLDSSLSLAKPVITINGLISDKDGNPLKSVMKWENLTTKQDMGNDTIGPDGKFYIALPAGNFYGYYAEYLGRKNDTLSKSEEYYPASDFIDLRNIDSIRNNRVKAIYKHIVLRYDSIIVRNIFFNYDSYEILPESEPELMRLVNYLKRNENKKIEIHGYSDQDGTDQHNNILSYNRAKSVRKYLVGNGITSRRIRKVKGWGKRKLLCEDDTDYCKSRNRRVEIIFR